MIANRHGLLFEEGWPWPVDVSSVSSDNLISVTVSKERAEVLAMYTTQNKLMATFILQLSWDKNIIFV